VIQLNISFAGAGKVAGILCREMYKAGCSIDLIVSESEKRGRPLADECNASWSDKLVFPDSTKVLIVAVPDSRLKQVLETVKCSPDTLVAHTAGSMGLDIFPERITRRGVFYPLQTFSSERRISLKDLPVFIEASDDQSSFLLNDLADYIMARKYFTDTEHRRLLHLAAVFVCNFTNHMLTEGKSLAFRAGFTFEELKPLIEETFLKAFEIGPENSQTGPAIRNDHNIIENHIELLSFDPGLQIIYKEISTSIINYYKKP